MDKRSDCVFHRGQFFYVYVPTTFLGRPKPPRHQLRSFRDLQNSTPPQIGCVCVEGRRRRGTPDHHLCRGGTQMGPECSGSGSGSGSSWLGSEPTIGPSSTKRSSIVGRCKGCGERTELQGSPMLSSKLVRKTGLKSWLALPVTITGSARGAGEHRA